MPRPNPRCWALRSHHPQLTTDSLPTLSAAPAPVAIASSTVAAPSSSVLPYSKSSCAGPRYTMLAGSSAPLPASPMAEATLHCGAVSPSAFPRESSFVRMAVAVAGRSKVRNASTCTPAATACNVRCRMSPRKTVFLITSISAIAPTIQLK
ncbi:hypothetical protein Vafri_18230 [Volvox africanus]|uniref:Uncharacterized protein n=1 Tax=Volvox africanus TaxID=51714 RepID=A0A8J4F8C1_9CHLO|nr:hypothetical protein Vafri_18230 [Volvox africanus]